MVSNKEKARQNERAVLQAVGTVGWLSATQVGRWVWGTENPRSARVSADNVLRRLQVQGLVMRRESGNGVYVYVLTTKGAAYANGNLEMSCFKPGYDLSQLDVARQAPAVEFLTEQHRKGHTVFGMAAVRKLIEDGILDKVLKGADGIVMNSATDQARAVLVVRSMHPELVKKAWRLKSAFGALELVGNAGLSKVFWKELKRL